MRTLFVLLLILLMLTGCGGSSQNGIEVRPIDVGTALGGEPAEGFERVDTVRQFHFPADHGPHPDFRNEWWYFTGNLNDEEGNRYGFQLTFFRIAVSPDQMERESDWATRQVYMAHFAITDAGEKEFHGFERFSRGAVGLAGAELDPLRVWIEDWEMTSRTGNEFPWYLSAASDETALSLTVEPLKDVVLQGEQGLSRKSQQAGNASYYYSITRLAAGGTITVGGVEHSVSGTAWLDREWGTSSLGENQTGWDWFALQLNDGSEVMYYQIRQKDGSADPNSQGVIVDAEGKVTRLRAADVELEALVSRLINS
ncbi:MAG: lipocalin-like domain-containing protein [Dehalococcoidia bacterium]